MYKSPADLRLLLNGNANGEQSGAAKKVIEVPYMHID